MGGRSRKGGSMRDGVGVLGSRWGAGRGGLFYLVLGLVLCKGPGRCCGGCCGGRSGGISGTWRVGLLG